MHIICFARVALEAVGMMERLEFTLCLLRSLTVHIPLLLQMADFTSALDELDDALVADKEEHDQKEQQRKFKKAEKAVKACEEKIAQMEAQLKEMDAILMQPEHATDMKLINEYAEIMRNLEAENDRWMTLSEELEALSEE